MYNSKERLKIFVSAYACEPDLGSEIGVGWHWVLEMSKCFDLWVLTRKSNQQGIEKWISEHSEYSHIQFLYFDLPKKLRFWKKGMRGVRTYYNIWQWCTNAIVKQTMQENGIEIFHHLTYGNSLWAVSSYGQRQFFIWGPTGGVETIPADYSRHYSAKGRVIEWLRRTVVACLPLNYGFNKRCKNAKLILCKTENMKAKIPTQYRSKAILFTDVAVEPLGFKECKKQECDRIEYLSVGRLDAWRGFDILIEAFAEAVKQNKNIHLTIAGKGADEKRLQRIVAQKGIGEYVNMVGKVSMERYYELMQNCDVVVNPCLKEGAVTVSFDSMAMGKPLICTDTTGYTRYFSNEYAIVIPLKGRDEVIKSLRKAIVLLTNSNTRKTLGERALEQGKQFSWQKRGEDIYNVITGYVRNG